MRRMKGDLTLEVLEGAIDSNGLNMVLGMIRDICHGKAAHLEVDWQDTITAQGWRNAGDQIDICARSSAVTRVSKGGSR